VEDVAAKTPAEFRISLHTQHLTEDTLAQLESIFASAPGSTAVVFELRSPDGTMALLQSQKKIRVSPELAESVRLISSELEIQRVF